MTRRVSFTQLEVERDDALANNRTGGLRYRLVMDLIAARKELALERKSHTALQVLALMRETGLKIENAKWREIGKDILAGEYAERKIPFGRIEAMLEADDE